MPRLIITLSCVALTVGAESAASAAGPFGGSGAPVRAAPSRGFAAPHLRAVPAFRAAAPQRVFGPGAHGRHQRYARWGGYGGVWPWYDSGAQAGGGVTVVVREDATPPLDPYSFENLMPRTGIRPAPTPEPVIYRLEGSRAQPVTRVIRIGADTGRAGDVERAGRSRAGQNRIASAETGALLLSVPAR